MFDFKNVSSVTEDITTEYILKRTSQEDIFTHYFPNFSYKNRFSSPFRQDRTPSFGFFYKHNAKWIKAHDFSTGERWNCFEFVMKLYNTTFPEALNIICRDFRLANVTTNKEIIKPKIYFKEDKEEVRISVKVKDYNKWSLNYWSDYSITEEELLLGNIYSIEWFKIRGNRINCSKSAYSIYIPGYEKDYFKILQPHNDKYKWVTNCPLHIPFDTNLPLASDTLIITKSVKDSIILKRLYTDVLPVQNESLSAVSCIKKYTDLYEKVYLFFDNDATGIEQSNMIAKEYGWSQMFINKTDVTDPSDYVKSYDFKSLKQNIHTIE